MQVIKNALGATPYKCASQLRYVPIQSDYERVLYIRMPGVGRFFACREPEFPPPCGEG